MSFRVPIADQSEAQVNPVAVLFPSHARAENLLLPSAAMPG